MNKNSFVYTNIPQEWLSKVESTREKLEKKRMEDKKNSRGSTSILRSTLKPKAVEKERNAFKRRYKTIPKAGLFAHAVCSSDYRNLDKMEKKFERESYQESPELKKQRWELPPNFSVNKKVESTPRFSDLDDVGRGFEEESRHDYSKLEKQQWEVSQKFPLKQEDFDDDERESGDDFLEEFSLNTKTKMEATPRLQRQASDAETNLSKTEQLIEHFSRRLDSLKFEPELFIRTNIPLAKLETGILNRVLKQADGKKTIPVADIIEKNSEILLYAEDLKNTKNYIPSDPHFLTDELASNFDSHMSALEKQKSLNLFKDFQVENSNKEEEDEGDLLNFSADLFSTSKDEEKEEDFFDEKEYEDEDDTEESQSGFNIFNIFKSLDDPEVPSTSSSSLPPFKEYLENEKKKEESSWLNFLNL